MDLRQQLLDLLENGFRNNKQKFLISLINSKNRIELRNQVILETNYLIKPTFSQRIYHVLNTDKIPTCYCGNFTKFSDLSKGYKEYCSPKCRTSSIKVREKREQTCMERFGVKNPNMNEEIKRKKKEYFLEKFGGICPAKNEEVQKKLSEKNSSEEVQNKTKRTNLEKYGVEFSSQGELIKERNRVKNFYKLLNNQKIISKVTASFNENEYIDVHKKYEFICNACKTEFLSDLTYGHIPRCPECYPLFSTSLLEKEVFKFLKTLNIIVKENQRDIIKPYELDLYLPDYNLAIEFDGLYWHSEIGGKKQSKYHLGKTEECLKKGIQLIHIFEDEWLDKQEIIKSIILSKLGQCDKLYAREAEFIEVEEERGQKFLKENHLQGENNRILRFFGLIHKQELVQLLGIGNPRYSNNNNYELIRSCTLLNTKVVGGFEKLMKNIPLKGSIISYVDRRYFNGNSYKYWNYEGKTSSNYYYMDAKNYINKQSRLKFQKHKLPELFPNVYDNNLTEWEIMQLAGYDRIWDCGNLVYSRIL